MTMLIIVMKTLEGDQENDFNVNPVEFQVLMKLTSIYPMDNWKSNMIEGKEFTYDKNF